jgi:hypothetical protein
MDTFTGSLCSVFLASLLNAVIHICFRILLAVPDLLRCCLWAPGRHLYLQFFGNRGDQLLEVVAQAGSASHAEVGPRFIPRPVPRYGPPPGSLPVPVFATNSGRPSTSRVVRSLVECRLPERSSRTGQALQLALGDLHLAMRHAEVGFPLVCLFVSCLAIPAIFLCYFHN